ncbi:hypothetical protein K435DRAFT_909014, partial [Dendrothele bispora CBS 962.96]
PLVSGSSTTTLTSVDASGSLASGTSAVTAISADAPGPLASGTSTTTVANEEDDQTHRTMFNGSYHPEFNNSVLSNVGGNKHETNNVYHIYGNATVYCSSADLAALRINPTGSSEIVLQDATSSRPGHVNHGDTKTDSTLHTSAEEIGSTTGITTSHRAQREPSACEEPSSRLGSCTRGKKDQQTSKSG